MKKTLLTAALLCALSVPCFAARYEMIGNVIESKYYLDVDSITGGGPYMYSFDYKIVHPSFTFDNSEVMQGSANFSPHKENAGENSRTVFKNLYKYCTGMEATAVVPTGTDVNIRTEPNTNCQVIGTMNPEGSKYWDCDFYSLEANQGDGTWTKIAMFVPMGEYWELTVGYVKNTYLKASNK